MTMLTKHFVQDREVVTRRIVGETIIVPVRSHVVDLDCIYTLDEVGTLIWERLDGQTDGHQIVAAVCQEYEVTPEEAAHDLQEFLHTMEAAGLIRLCQDHEESGRAAPTLC